MTAIKRLATAAACRVGILAAGVTVAATLAASPAAAATNPQCATGSNPATGQTIQVCAAFTGVFNGNSGQAVLACAAQSGPASVSTQESCYIRDSGNGAIYGASSASAPGDAAASVSQFPISLTAVVGTLQVCLAGSATDAGGNVVSVPPASCF
ncbi:MAG TPA: hypothetical protein VN193_06240 [Candidatus Angelobacter sp.]|jgi:hypothetical protein|nr:hypothetical protein [Candidatus Angelobacter sp.]